MAFRNSRNIGALGTHVSRRKRAASAGISVLTMSALALPVGLVAAAAGDSHPGTANAYRDEAGFLAMSGRLQALLGTLGPLGVSGALPRNSRPSPVLVDHAQTLAKFAATAGRGGLRSRAGQSALHELGGNPAALPNLRTGPIGIPAVMLLAYRRAQQIMATQQPSCHLPWWLLAGIGQVESDQADGGRVDAQGNTLTPILGPVLDGANGYAALPASGGGWQRAIGPMQFLPSTWSTWGGGGNPNNVYDAALAAGRYLCVGGWNLSDPAQQVMAVFSYNHSDSYVQLVLSWAYAFAGGVTPLPMSAFPLLPPSSGFNTAAPGSPARPSPRPKAAARSSSSSSSSAKPAASSPSHPRSSSPASTPPTPKPTPKPTPIPLPSLPLPTPSPTLP